VGVARSGKKENPREIKRANKRPLSKIGKEGLETGNIKDGKGLVSVSEKCRGVLKGGKRSLNVGRIKRKRVNGGREKKSAEQDRRIKKKDHSPSWINGDRRGEGNV